MRAPYSRNLFDLACEQAERYADRVAVISGETRATYPELVQRARRVAAALRAAGIGRGDRVGMLVNNRIEWIDVCLGAAAIGAVPVPVQHLVEAARDRFPDRGFARARAVRARPVRRPGLRRRPHGAAAEARRSATRRSETVVILRRRFGARRPDYATSFASPPLEEAAAAGRARRRRRHRLHPLHLRVDRVSQGGPAPARRHDRERVQHRRAPGPAARRAGAPATAAVLVLRLGQRACCATFTHGATLVLQEPVRRRRRRST